MTQPLALILYERLFPGGTLVNRMQDLGYRVQALNEPSVLAPQAERDKPLLALIDLEPRQADACRAIADVRRQAATAHLPIIAFAPPANTTLHESARAAGATLVVHDNVILPHLPQFLEQALRVE